jgi:hypothetical protein
MSFKNIQKNEIFDLLINSYKEFEEFGEEPMDGGETESMASSFAIQRGWSSKEKHRFLNYANIREGNTNPQDFDINLNEMKEKDRMQRLTQSFGKKGEIFKEERDSTNSEKLSEEFKRLSALASGENTASLRESQFSPEGTGGAHGVNQGRTVNSVVDNMYSNPTQYQGAQGNNIAIKDSEALEISIKRTLNSGAPVNNIAFYDEVNWNLAQLGFPSKIPQDIKVAISKLIS